MEVTSNVVIARNAFGRFLSECDAAATATVQDLIEDGAKMSAAFAPKGKKPNRYGVRLADSIYPAMLSDREGVWGSDLPYALVQETGGSGWPITGPLNFWWDNMGRRFTTPRGMISKVSHPGMAGHHYLRKAYEVVMARWSEYARRHYPQ